MAKTNTASNPLAGFGFDGDSEDFFGITSEKLESQTSKTIKEVKKSPAELENEEDDDLGDSTNFDDAKPKKKSKGSDEEEDDLDPENMEFFTDKPAPPKKKSVKAQDDEEEEEEVTPKKTPKKGGKKKDEEEEEEPDPDDDDEDAPVVKKKKPAKTDEQEEEEDEEQIEKDKEFCSTLALELKEKGILEHIEIKKGTKLTEDQFFELQAMEVDERFQEALEGYAKDLDQDGKDFLKFKKDGGRTSDFVAVYVTGTLGLDKFDSSKPEQVDAVINHYLTKYEKVTGEDLEDRKEFIKDKGQEKIKAEAWYDKIKTAEDKNKDALMKAQEKASKQREIDARDFEDDFSKVLDKTEAVGMFPIGKAERKELNSYINRATVKVGPNRYVPPVNAELSRILRAETEKDKQDLIILAKLLKNNFKIDDELITEIETKVVKRTKSKLQEAKKGVKPSSSGSYTKRSMADYFEEG